MEMETAGWSLKGAVGLRYKNTAKCTSSRNDIDKLQNHFRYSLLKVVYYYDLF